MAIISKAFFITGLIILINYTLLLAIPIRDAQLRVKARESWHLRERETNGISVAIYRPDRVVTLTRHMEVEGRETLSHGQRRVTSAILCLQSRQTANRGFNHRILNFCRFQIKYIVHIKS